MCRYAKIEWEGEAGNLPRLIQWDSNIEEAELIEIITAKAKRRLLSISEYQLKPRYLTVYLGVNFNRHEYNNSLIVTLSDTCTEKFGNSLALLKCFGKFAENEVIYDAIRCSLHNVIIREVGESTMYFEEFVTDYRGRYYSILEILGRIFKAFAYHIDDRVHIKTMCQRLTEVYEN